MNLFLYLDKNTLVHRLDPLTKILGTLILFLYSLCFNHPLYLCVMSLMILVLAFFSRAMVNLYRFRFVLLLLFLFSTLIWPFFIKGSRLVFSWKGLEVSQESFLYGLAMGLRLSNFVATGLIFLSTTRHEELIHGLIRMKTPYPIAFALSTALRLIPTFVGAGATIIRAQISRGLNLESGSIFGRFRKFIPQAVPLLIYAIRYTNLLAIALESKGFSPEAKRTFYYESHMKRIDYFILLILIGGLLLILYLRIGLSLGAIFPNRV